MYNHARAQKICLLGHEIINFGRYFLGNNYIHCLSDISLGVEEKILKEKGFSI